MTDAVPRHILVPLDGSTHAESVLPHVEQLAGQGTRVTLVRVLEPKVRAAVIEADEDEVAFGSEKVQEVRLYLQRIKARLHGAGIESKILLMHGLATDGILEAARHVDADLLTLSARGRSGLRKALLGNVALGLLNRARCPLYLVPAGEPDAARPSHILVPLDGSSRAEDVLPHVAWLAERHRSRITLLRVVRSGHQMTVLDDVDRELDDPKVAHHLLQRVGQNQELARLRDAQAYLKKQREALRAQGLTCDARLVHGRPTESILEIAHDLDVRLVALTNHARMGLAGILYGTVASGLLGRLGRPMLVVPTGEPPTRDIV